MNCTMTAQRTWARLPAMASFVEERSAGNLVGTAWTNSDGYRDSIDRALIGFAGTCDLPPGFRMRADVSFEKDGRYWGRGTEASWDAKRSIGFGWSRRLGPGGPLFCKKGSSAKHGEYWSVNHKGNVFV
jgi:hypothetical protein